MDNQEIIYFDGIYETSESKPNTDYIFSELIETRSRDFNWIIKPHIHHNLFQIFFLVTGKITLKQAVQTQILDAPCILIIPHSHLHGFTYSEDSTGRILSFSSSIMDNIFPDSSPIQVALNANIQNIQAFDEQNTFEFLLLQMQQFDQELFGSRPEKRAMLKAYFMQLLVSLYRLLEVNELSKNVEIGQSLAYFRKFQRSIKQAEYPKSMKQFADELSISTVHLNRICHEVSGKTSLQLVQEFTLEEAKKYLNYTTYSVAEIAYILKFEYPNYFAKFFKKHTQKTPTEYRENNEVL